MEIRNVWKGFEGWIGVCNRIKNKRKGIVGEGIDYFGIIRELFENRWEDEVVIVEDEKVVSSGIIF